MGRLLFRTLSPPVALPIPRSDWLGEQRLETVMPARFNSSAGTCPGVQRHKLCTRTVLPSPGSRLLRPRRRSSAFSTWALPQESQVAALDVR